MKNKRVYYCDFLRLFAILAVMFMHSITFYRLYALDTSKTQFLVLSILDVFTRTAVPIFFMLTGMFMLGRKDEETYFEFFKKRVLKLLIPFTIISAFYYVCIELIHKNSLSLVTFIDMFTSGDIYYHFWFMYSIILIYLLIPFLNKLINNIDKKGLKSLILVLFISNILYLINGLSNQLDLQLFKSFQFPSLLLYINYLFLGYYIYKYGVDSKNHKKLYILSIISMIVMVVGDHFIAYTDKITNEILINPMSPLTFIVTLGFVTYIKQHYDKWNVKPKIQNFITKVVPSIFYIYMVHALVLDMVRKVTQKFISYDALPKMLLLIIVEFILTVVISFIIGIVINKIYTWISKKFAK